MRMRLFDNTSCVIIYVLDSICHFVSLRSWEIDCTWVLTTYDYATGTPLWRNGPPEKPVLCNACGSRWRTKGTLANYTPLHARAESDELEDLRFSRVKTISIKNKESKVLKRKLNSEIAEFGVIPPDHNQGLHKVFDEDTSNRSSSGSAISNSEKYAQYGVAADTSDLTS